MKKIILPLVALFLCLSAVGQTFVPNYDEAAMPAFTLPDPLVFANGSKVKDAGAWEKRRAELIQLFASEEYGFTPEGKVKMEARKVSEVQDACQGKAIRQELDLTLSREGKSVTLQLLVVLPKTSHRVPVFLAYNFNGNHTVTEAPGVRVASSWVRNFPEMGITDNHSNESLRGSDTKSWPLDSIVARGYGVVTLYYGDVDPDFDDGFKNGVHPLFGGVRDSSSWGSIAAWAWALSRITDYLVTDKRIDHNKIIVLGHSRLGKTALWAGANDKRFAIVVSNESGMGGAALSKRIYGETAWRINTSFPHWFCTRFRNYNNNEGALAFDQHELLALIAPRPLYVCSAEGDKWSDPKGEFLSCVYASPVYELLGKPGVGTDKMPELHHPVGGTIGYHIRAGSHGILLYDWERFMDFADAFFLKK
ncbi:MAG: hypothetical protein LWW85_07325 [Marinilabiliales bacterium]|nr:hypothetical protein [Marinilabiliales bacterium]